MSLFGYVLGPTLTADGLLHELINSKDEFYKVLKNDNKDKIFTGYGTQNALLVARNEFISDAFGTDRAEDFSFDFAKTNAQPYSQMFRSKRTFTRVPFINA